MSEGDTSRNDEIKFTNWKNNEPDNYRGEENCGVMVDYGKWGDISCASFRKPVCSDVVGEEFMFLITFMFFWF